MIVLFGTACPKFLDERMHGLKMTHWQFDEQWTFVGKKQARLTVEEKATCHDIGDVYLWTCIMSMKPLRKHFRQHRQTQERPGDFDERKPFGVITGDGHEGTANCKLRNANCELVAVAVILAWASFCLSMFALFLAVRTD